ncbi:rhodanese-like domain-containing protein [Cellulophaga sp. HaHaR_3_176]|uniref:rhodanese-like domain-containing protein n=1 Tax=Cellulophaga sp. HaHaR_3_176 TaxID=1942464 RepID=UPI001C2005EE|nr:rhodanese-like domain-containing protein [Cellulophaga sp. HaHaR_3_176]QWX83038.1 rhodanese-like domain-containing protein [Cellulophaga sp. HaHaR_3_176]
MRLVITLILLFLFNVNYAQNKSKSITEVSQSEFDNNVLLDVRTPEEYNEGHLLNALNINWFDKDFMIKVEKEFNKKEILYVYCKVGGRSAKAAKKLDSLGYVVVNLEGGYDAYLKTKK